MGAAERLSRASGPAPERRRSSSSEHDEAFELDHWCVEIHEEIVCLSTRQVWMGLAQGRLRPETPVWRDGLGHWVAISALPDFTEEPLDDEEPVSVPERSEVRLRRVALPVRTTVSEELPSSRVWGGLRAWAASASQGARRGARAVGRFGRRVLVAPRRAITWRNVGAGVAFSLVFAGLISLTLSGLRPERATIPRAQRFAVDVAERARFVSARVRTKSLENEQAWWHDRWR